MASRSLVRSSPGWRDLASTGTPARPLSRVTSRLVNLSRGQVGGPMRPGALNELLEALSEILQ